MAQKKDETRFSVSKAEAAKYSRSEQRLFLDRGMIQGADPEPAPEGATVKAKAK